jgi:hypothetical protein
VNLPFLAWLLAVSSHVGQDQFGRFPFVNDDGDFLGGGTSWGLVLPDLDNGSWGRVCEESFGPVVAFALRQEGRIVLGGVDGLWETMDAGCSYRSLENTLAGQTLAAWWVDPSNADHLLVGTGTTSQENGLWESFDGGNSFVDVLSPRGAFFFHLTASPEGEQIAASGTDVEGRPLLLASRDGGASFTDLSTQLTGRSIVRALAFDGDELIVGGLNDAGQGALDRLTFVGSEATVTSSAVFTRETTHAVVFRDKLYVIAKNGARGELLVQADESSRFDVVSGGPTDCVFVHAGVLFGCGKQAGLNTSLFLRSDDGAAWQEQIAFREVHYRSCPETTPGYAACGLYIETSCADDDDNDSDGLTDCADDDCKVALSCTAGTRPDDGNDDNKDDSHEGSVPNDESAAPTSESCDSGRRWGSTWFSVLVLWTVRLGLRRRRRTETCC